MAMYNRYIQHDRNEYARLDFEDLPPPPRSSRPSLSAFRRLWEQLRSLKPDSSDLMILLLLFALYEADADEETLIALGLLLIL